MVFCWLSFEAAIALKSCRSSRVGSQRPLDFAIRLLVLCKLTVKESHMATNLALDQDLLDRAFKVSGEPTKKAAVTRALQEFIARREQRRIADLFGKLEWDPSFNYKAERSRKA
jgi:Arc/MetJ family transcription regulator